LPNRFIAASISYCAPPCEIQLAIVGLSGVTFLTVALELSLAWCDVSVIMMFGGVAATLSRIVPSSVIVLRRDSDGRESVGVVQK